jgi:hypothetical protein
MTACASCGTDVPASDAFCSTCGHAVAERSRPSVATRDVEDIGGREPPPARTGVTEDLSSPPRRPTPPAASVHRDGASSAGIVIPPAVQDSELEGQAVPNQFYVGQRLGYKDGGAESLDPVNARFFLAIFMHWAAVFVIFAIGGAVIFVVGRILGSTKLTGLLWGLWWLVMGIVAWWFPVWASISEWKFMVDGKAAAATEAFQHITWVFEQRQSPIDRMKIHRLSFGRGQSREYLYVQDGVFRVFISCFPYGQDLYVGWTMWWRLSAVRWFWTYVTRFYQAFTLRGSELHLVHRYDSAKALREAVHGAAREGLDVAAGLIQPGGTGTAGSGIAVEDLGAMENLERTWSGLSRRGST